MYVSYRQTSVTVVSLALGMPLDAAMIYLVSKRSNSEFEISDQLIWLAYEPDCDIVYPSPSSALKVKSMYGSSFLFFSVSFLKTFVLLFIIAQTPVSNL